MDTAAFRKTVLVIDDHPDLRKLVREILEAEGYDVHEAANGREAVERYRANRADLLITDIFMPEQDGLEVIEKLHGEYPDLKIIAMSGGGGQMAPELYLRVAERIGAFRTLAKPFRIEDLLALVNEAFTE